MINVKHSINSLLFLFVLLIGGCDSNSTDAPMDGLWKGDDGSSSIFFIEIDGLRWRQYTYLRSSMCYGILEINLIPQTGEEYIYEVFGQTVRVTVQLQNNEIKVTGEENFVLVPSMMQVGDFVPICE